MAPIGERGGDRMDKKITYWQTVCFLFLSVMGTLLHFLFDWSGGSWAAALIAPVNESVWEHLKLLVFPMVAFALAQSRWSGIDPRKVLARKGAGCGADFDSGAVLPGFRQPGEFTGVVQHRPAFPGSGSGLLGGCPGTAPGREQCGGMGNPCRNCLRVLDFYIFSAPHSPVSGPDHRHLGLFWMRKTPPWNSPRGHETVPKPFGTF